jgi:hypothetical protein
VLRGSWCDGIVLNVRARAEGKSDDPKDSFFEQAFIHFHKYHINILLHFNLKLRRVDILKPPIANESLCEKVIIKVLE